MNEKTLSAAVEADTGDTVEQLHEVRDAANEAREALDKLDAAMRSVGESEESPRREIVESAVTDLIEEKARKIDRSRRSF